VNDHARIEKTAEIRGGMSRRHLLGLGALGLAGILGSPLALARASAQESPPPAGARLLLKGGRLLTLDRSRALDRGDVLIENARITSIGPSIQPDGAEVIDCAGMIVMPGFVDTHRHMWQGLLRNIGPDDLLLDYLNKMLFGFAPKLTPDDVYLGDLITALSAMNSGITTILDWSHINATPQHADAAIRALREAGIRAVYAYGPNFGITPAWYDNLDNPYPGDIRRLRTQYFASTDQLLTLAIAAAGPEFAPLQAAEIEWKTAREIGARISVHVGVGQGGKQGLLGQLADKVGLKDDTTYIHACTLSDAEWDRIRATGGTVSLAIPIEMQMGHGMPPIQRALDRGIRPSLSIDVETNQPTDMFTQMRACFALQRALVNEGHLFRSPDPDLEELRAKLVTVRDVLEFATIEGARANSLAHRIGTLTPGKDADILLLRATQPNVAPVNDTAGAVVLGMDTSNVDSVFIAGKAVKWRGRLVGVDLDGLQRRAEQAREALLAKVK
jgi:cytosine/adenosine deaminase-related metal-dependent hydrolase